MFGKIPVLVIYHLGSFEDFIQSCFWVIPKITLSNLCKEVHNVEIIPVSSDPVNLQTGKERQKMTKNWISWQGKVLFRWSKEDASFK